jgi:hypothetical protein
MKKASVESQQSLNSEGIEVIEPEEFEIIKSVKKTVSICEFSRANCNFKHIFLLKIFFLFQAYQRSSSL